MDATLWLQRPLLASHAAVPMGDGLTPWARRAGEAAAAGGLVSSAIVGPRVYLHCKGTHLGGPKVSGGSGLARALGSPLSHSCLVTLGLRQTQVLMKGSGTAGFESSPTSPCPSSFSTVKGHWDACSALLLWEVETD